MLGLLCNPAMRPGQKDSQAPRWRQGRTLSGSPHHGSDLRRHVPSPPAESAFLSKGASLWDQRRFKASLTCDDEEHESIDGTPGGRLRRPGGATSG